MTATLEELRDRAIDEAEKTGTLSDIAQAIAVAKAVAEERKAIEDLTSTRRSLRSNQIQLIVAGITVIISVLGLVVTSVYNIAQISATREQIETTEWRDLLSSLDKPNANIAESLTVPFRLRSFANSKRYSQDARLIGAAVMSKIADIDGFRQLFNFIFADQRANDVGTIAEIDSQLYSSFQKNFTECQEKSQHLELPKNVTNVCWAAYTDKQVQDFGVKIEDLDFWKLRKAVIQQGAELAFISSQIAAAIRNPFTVNTENNNLKLSNVFLANADLSDIDFSHIDISGSGFDNVVLTHATLRPARFDNSTFNTSNWWDASIVDKKMLQWLIDTAFPSKSRHFFPPPTRPTRLEYVSAVLALCHKVDLPCTEAHVPYEEDETGLPN
jgi:uncharacterized protein YjbI with pentapeptide repeats